MPDTDRAVAELKAAKNIAFYQAGISAKSGIPTSRDKLTGVWSTHSSEQLGNTSKKLSFDA